MKLKIKLMLLIKKAVLLFVLFMPGYHSFSQYNDNVEVIGHFGGAVTVTTKGISTFPNLTLGKPAAILDLSMGGERLRFEPQFRFALDGKPWSFLFWCRYDLLKMKNFYFKTGFHPAFAFKTIKVIQDGNEKEVLRSQRYLAFEFSPNYLIAKNITVNPYYLYSRGLEKDIVQNSNFLAFRVNFSNITLGKQIFMKWIPQAYYLKMDENDGYYLTSTLTLAKRNLPFSLSSIINRKIKSEIAGDDFIWNLSLIYTFNTRYNTL